LIVLQKEATVESPEYINEVDCFISRPIYPWEVVTQIETTLDYRRVKERTKLLSQQLLTLNKELVDSQQTLQAQNKELDLINRRLHRLSELKETLTGMLVHDLKSPLSAMLGAMQFMTIDPNNTLSEGSRRILGGGLAAGRQMHRLTTTLLDEQKLENNQLVFDIEPTDLEETVLLCQEMMGPLFNMHKVHLEINLPPDLPPLQADPIILQRIIENLLDNAVKYSPANESIFINAALKNDMVEVSITDRGDGVPPEHREAIFERFTQLEHPKFGKIRGSVGLGLSFCKLAVETMGGRIWIDCPEDIGTTFFFTIPASTEEVKE
jgi:signal transduction histidine kinase